MEVRGSSHTYITEIVHRSQFRFTRANKTCLKSSSRCDRDEICPDTKIIIRIISLDMINNFSDTFLMFLRYHWLWGQDLRIPREYPLDPNMSNITNLNFYLNYQAIFVPKISL